MEHARVVGVADRRAERDVSGSTVQLSLLRCFELRVEQVVVSVPANVERMLAFLALQERPQPRQHVANNLWIDIVEERAAANLRNALWRARRVLGDWLLTDGSYLALSPEVDIDLRHLTSQARRLFRPGSELDERDTDTSVMIGDLLPDWDEEWTVAERERLRQLRVHALEALCHKLCLAGRNGEAVDVGLMAVSAEPLRESAQRLLVSAHLAEGNVSEARRQYHRFRDLLWDELGIEPSRELRALVGLPPQSADCDHGTPDCGTPDRGRPVRRAPVHGNTAKRPSTATGAAVKFLTSIQ
jgi:DNA-binding SARP family transcriptional activator